MPIKFLKHCENLSNFFKTLLFLSEKQNTLHKKEKPKQKEKSKFNLTFLLIDAPKFQKLCQNKSYYPPKPKNILKAEF